MRHNVDIEKCIACGACANVCPAAPVVFEIKDKSSVVHPESCVECGQCADACPVHAIELVE